MTTSNEGDDAGDLGEQEAERQARAMNDGLRKDVKAWASARAAGSAAAVDDIGVPKPTPPAPVRRVKQAKVAAVAAPPAPTQGRPFRMSYGGESTATHIAARLARGAR